MSRGDYDAILGGSDAKAQHVVRRDDPADSIRDDMGAGQSTMSRESLSHRQRRSEVGRRPPNDEMQRTKHGLDGVFAADPGVLRTIGGAASGSDVYVGVAA